VKLLALGLDRGQASQSSGDSGTVLEQHREDESVLKEQLKQQGV
jgi:hypothetical protein